jgi:hypothetical protein
MNVSEMVASTNLRTDEDFSVDQVVNFLNDGIAKVNAECNLKLPNVEIEKDEEYVIPEKWQRLLLVTWAAARIKQNDSSQFEYQDLYTQFRDNLLQFKTYYNAPDEYKESGVDNDTLQTDFSNSPWSWGGGW